MAELAQRLDCKCEEKWQAFWEKNKCFSFDENDSSRPVYSIDTPPPFTSGDLHMGHVLSYSYFDFVARYKRMQGFNVYFPQGWDCQGFPTEVRVEKKHGRKPPEEFRSLCRQWTEQCISNMKSQMQRMGFSADWKYEYRTMDPQYHKKVQLSILKMHSAGQVYRAKHPVFWCPNCRSALAKTDTDEAERSALLHDINFDLLLNGEKKEAIISTTRPELMHACAAVLFNPKDSRYAKYKGATALTALGKEVPILSDDDVDMEFGSGLVMVCTFGDKQDVVWMYRHKLPYVEAMDDAGRLKNAGEFDGLKCEEAKKKILEKFKNEGKLLSSKPITQAIKVHDRCGRAVELANSWQWFAKITDKKKSIVSAAKKMRWVPPFAISHLENWAEFVEWDWVISRQRIFGTPIPFWICEKCSKIIPAKEEELPANPPVQKKKCACGGEAKGESSVFDCWVDSSITPLIISKWEEDGEFFKRAYPASLRPQGVEIIRTWAFYTIYRCLELTGKPPFVELLLNGNVLAPDGKKMSKSLGNIIAPDKLIDESGADSVRIWAALSGAMAKDRPFSHQDIKYAKSFLNKFLNAGKFVQKSIAGYAPSQADGENLRTIDKYFLHRLNEITLSCAESWENYEFHRMVKTTHDFFWHEFCDYYLEYVKNRIYSQEDCPDRRAAQYTLHTIYSQIILLLSPITPHACEEAWQIFKEGENSSVQFEKYPKASNKFSHPHTVGAGKLLEKLVAQIRQEKANKKLSLNSEVQALSLALPAQEAHLLENIEGELKSVCNIQEIKKKEGAEFSLKLSFSEPKEG